MKDQGRKQVKALKVLKSMFSNSGLKMKSQKIN